MKKILLLLSISISFASYTIVFTHMNFFDIDSGSYIYDCTISVNNSGYLINPKKIPKESITLDFSGKYALPGFFLSYINAIKYPDLDLWSNAGITAAFSYSNYSYELSRISLKDPSVLIDKNLYIANYAKNACDLITSNLIFKSKYLSLQTIEYSIFLKNPRIIVVYPQSIKYLSEIMEIAKEQKIPVICKINSSNEFKMAIDNKVKFIIGIPQDKIDFQFSPAIAIISNISSIEKKYGKNSSEYKNAMYNLKIFKNNGNEILIGNFGKIGIPFSEIDDLSKILSSKDIIFGLTKYPYSNFKYRNNSLLIFDKNPVENIKNIKTLLLVIKNGNISNLMRGSIDYSKEQNKNIFKSIDNTSLLISSSIYPVISFDKKKVGIGTSIYFPKINCGLNFSMFLGKSYSPGYEFGINYKDYMYNYDYINSKYEKRSIIFDNGKYKYGYYGEYVLSNPFPYPEYDSGLFENAFLETKILYALIGIDRISSNYYWKLQCQIESKKAQNVRIFIGISNSNFYQYKINMGNIELFNNFESVSNFLFSINVEKKIDILKGIFNIPIGGNAYLYDRGFGIYIYTGINIGNISGIFMIGSEKSQLKLGLVDYSFK